MLILHNSMFLFSLNPYSILIWIFCLLPFMPWVHVTNWRIRKNLRSCGMPLPTLHCFRASNCRLLHRRNLFWAIQKWLTLVSWFPLLLGWPLLLFLFPCSLPTPTLNSISDPSKPDGDICSLFFPIKSRLRRTSSSSMTTTSIKSEEITQFFVTQLVGVAFGFQKSELVWIAQSSSVTNSSKNGDVILHKQVCILLHYNTTTCPNTIKTTTFR